MRHLNLLAVAAAATLSLLFPLASVATGSGASATFPAGTDYTGNVHASSEGHVAIGNLLGIECNATLEGEVKTHGSGEALSIQLTSLSFTGCTGGWTATVAAPGTLSIDPVVGSKDGTVTWTGATFTFARAGTTCRYVTSNTYIGLLTGSNTTGGTATIDLNGKLPFHSGSIACGTEGGTFDGSYTIDIPDYLDVDTVEPGTTPTSPAGTPYTGKFNASSEGHIVIDSAVGKIECSSTLEGEVKSHGYGAELSFPLTALAFTGCTSEWSSSIVSRGTLTIHPIAGTQNGTVTWTKATVAFTIAGITCRYKTESTDIGTLTGSKTTRNTATIDLSGKLLFHNGSIFCGTAATTITGNYRVETPDYLDVDAVG